AFAWAGAGSDDGGHDLGCCRNRNGAGRRVLWHGSIRNNRQHIDAHADVVRRRETPKQETLRLLRKGDRCENRSGSGPKRPRRIFSSSVWLRISKRKRE